MPIPIRRCFLRTCLSILISSTCLLSQNQPLVSDPQAITLASLSIAALTRGSVVSDVRLTANVTWIAGTEPESGTGIFLAKGTSESRIDLEFNSGGTRTEIRNGLNGPAGKWVNPDGKSGKYAFHNCLTDAAWFFPALSALTNVVDPHFVFSYLGEGVWNGLPTKHLRVYQVQSGFKEARRLSTMDFYLDPTSLLMLGVAYETHADNNMNVDLPSEIRFDDYRSVNGVEVPFHIQRLQSGSVAIDVTVNGATFNAGLSGENFDIR
jgi:hypothetical protein